MKRRVGTDQRNEKETWRWKMWNWKQGRQIREVGKKGIIDRIKREKREPGVKEQDQTRQYLNGLVFSLLLLKHTAEVFWYPFSCFEVAYDFTFIDFHAGLVRNSFCLKKSHSNRQHFHRSSCCVARERTVSPCISTTFMRPFKAQPSLPVLPDLTLETVSFLRRIYWWICYEFWNKQRRFS